MSFIILAFFLQVQSLCLKDEYYSLNEKNTFSLPKLPYKYDSLQPQYWNQLLYFHHDSLHNSLTSSLNDLVESDSEYQDKTITELLINYASANYTLWRYAGGYYNHCLFWWSLLSFKCSDAEPSGELLSDIQAKWGSFEEFKNRFNTNAKGLYGSGWIWLCVDSNGDLVIKAKVEEYSPLGEGYFPVLGLDMWEHSYYFYYLWDKGAYVDAWWDIIDWGLIGYLYEEYSKNLIAIPV